MNDDSGEDLTNEIITTYGAPRRYDLATLMTVSVFFAVLISIMKAFQAEPWFIALSGTFIVFVGLAQAILFGGRAPRRASLLAGMILGPSLILFEAYWEGYPIDFPTLLLAMLWYEPIGYLVGALVGGLFLVSDYWRRLAKRLRRGK